MSYGIHEWYGNLSVKLKKKQTLQHYQDCNENCGMERLSIAPNMIRAVCVQRILADPFHILHPEYVLLPSGGTDSPNVE